MRYKNKKVRLTVLLIVLMTAVLSRQTRAAEPDPMTQSIQDGAEHVRRMFTVAAEQMSEEDYAFRPTQDVRSFGELLVHVAETNYWFCSAASGEKTPVSNIKKTTAKRADIQKVLSASFAYCESAYAGMADEASRSRMIDLMGKRRPALVALNFRNYHALLHWGNAITYMRLRGKVPPSN